MIQITLFLGLVEWFSDRMVVPVWDHHLGTHTTQEEITAAVEILVSGVERIRSMTPG